MTSVAFVSASTQYENLGDCVILGALAHILRRRAGLRVLAHDAPADFLAAAEIHAEEVAQPSEFRAAIWSRAIRTPRHAARDGLVVAYKGGGVAERRGPVLLARSIPPLLAAAGLRAAGARQVRVGFSYSDCSLPIRWLDSVRHRTYDLALPRDGRTAALLGTDPPVTSGDLAAASPLLGSRGATQRGQLTVSIRGMRVEDVAAGDPRRVADALRVAAERGGLRVAALSQVRRDDAAMRRWADQHGLGPVVVWDGTSAGRDAVLAEYRSSAVVVSDRLHVLLFGLYCGALPVGIVHGAHGKVASFFRTNGLDDLLVQRDDLGHLPHRISRAVESRAVAARLDQLRSVGERTRLQGVVDAFLSDLP